ncbi:hypothetical protein ACH5RR_038323 [Cinchona calisaya]|uniref:DUF7356 domain-containing protein n=1 Tax=Cinchona calisaya TaxID=153742 RepID=A0ABD2XZ27_9GENT
MGLRYTVLGLLILALIIFNCSQAADSEVQGDLKTGKNVKDSGVSNKNDSGKEQVVTPEKKGKDQVSSGSKEGGADKVDEDKGSKQVELKGAGSEPNRTDNTGGEPKKIVDTGAKPNKTGAEKKKTDDTVSQEEKPSDMGTKKEVDKKEKAKGDLRSKSNDVSAAQVRKEGGEVCDSSSNRCTIEEKSVIGCLRVAGSESEEFSLLIQNKGKGPVSVTISAPDFVRLEKNQIQVQDNKNEEVKVSIGKGESKSGIILKAGNGNCTIDFKEMSSQNSKKNTVSDQLAYINLLKSTPSLWFILFAALLVIASVCIGITFRRKYFAKNSPSYEKLEMELPVSGVNKAAPDSNDGWDESWGDSWDDEEAPKTLSLPVTPSLSSHGIASRRINKDAWKD